MVAKKRASKRQTLQQKYKIIKRCKEHKKRVKKGVITNTTGHKKQKRSENRIPNAWPFKEDLLKEIQAAKEKMEEVKLRQKEKRGEEFNKRRGLGKATEEDQESDDDEMDADDNDEEGSEEEEEEAADENVAHDSALGQNSRRAYLTTLRKVIERADIILHVLDARDPLGTRSTAVEEMIANKLGKKLVFILNKSDLIPRENLQQWLNYFRASHPCLAFKSNTQQQRQNLSQSHSGKVTHSDEDILQSTAQAVGAEEVLQLLKNYARHDAGHSSKTIISVGIVGFPNVGKSSLINSLLRRRVVGVSPLPGHTKSLQEVILDKNIRLIDSPGVVFSSDHDDQATKTVLRNCVNVDEIGDYLSVIQALLQQINNTEYLMQLYNVPRFNDFDAQQFLQLVGRAQGRLKKGGIVNVDAAARAILNDWNHGKIRYSSEPPALPESHTEEEGGEKKMDTQLLTTLSEGIDWTKWRTEGTASNDAAPTSGKQTKKQKKGGKKQQAEQSAEDAMET